jgi:metallo-beta-lactamase family protein
MEITCYGAARCVTGSCFLLDNGKKYLIDCGLFQGGKEMEGRNREPWGFHPGEVSALFLTHAHIDHCGRLPKLVRDGFHGKIYTTLPTAELVKILLLDSAHIQEVEAELQTRKNRRRGSSEIAPLYTVADAEACFPLLEVVPRDELIRIDARLGVCFRNAGHILGSSILEVWSGSPAAEHKIVFSGDLGHKDQLIVKDPQSIFTADTLLIESTYGDRNHKSLEESRAELLEAIRYSYQHHEKVIIPAFAVERTQELLYVLGEFFRDGLIPSMPVYLDSPLAIAATEIFRRMRDDYDEAAAAIVHSGRDPFSFPQLVLTRSTEESMAINQAEGPAIVIAGNGMCTAGRIKHHLKHNLWRNGVSLVIVGFQAAGTLGRKLVDGERTVKLYGEKVVVRARVFTIGGFSAHADQALLLDWVSHFQNPKMRVYVVHGEPSVSESFASLVSERFGFLTHVPAMGEVIALRPTRAESVPTETAGLHAEQLLSRLRQKAGELQGLLAASSPELRKELWAQLETELARTEVRLDAALTEASRAGNDRQQGASGG